MSQGMVLRMQNYSFVNADEMYLIGENVVKIRKWRFE